MNRGRNSKILINLVSYFCIIIYASIVILRKDTTCYCEEISGVDIVKEVIINECITKDLGNDETIESGTMEDSNLSNKEGLYLFITATIILYLISRYGNDIIELLFNSNNNIETTVYEDAGNFYSDIYDSLIIDNSVKRLSINDSIKLVINKTNIFLAQCTYKPLTITELSNPEHKFNCLLTVIAASHVNASYSITKDLLCLIAGCLIKQSVKLPEELETVQRVFIETFVED